MRKILAVCLIIAGLAGGLAPETVLARHLAEQQWEQERSKRQIERDRLEAEQRAAAQARREARQRRRNEGPPELEESDARDEARYREELPDWYDTEEPATEDNDRTAGYAANDEAAEEDDAAIRAEGASVAAEAAENETGNRSAAETANRRRGPRYVEPPPELLEPPADADDPAGMDNADYDYGYGRRPRVVIRQRSAEAPDERRDAPLDEDPLDPPGTAARDDYGQRPRVVIRQRSTEAAAEIREIPEPENWNN